MNYIGKLDHLRNSKRLSFYELGLRCKLSESCIKKIFYGKSVPLVSSVEKLCKVLDVSLPELFCDTDELVFKASSEIVELISFYDSLPLEAKRHFYDLLKTLKI